MRLLITGASGYLGKYVVAEALRQGHQVRAVVRPASSVTRLAWHNHPSVELVRLDLRRKDGIVDALRGVDAVIHLAVVKDGDFYARFAGTVIATENLLDAMIQAEVFRLVDISTFSVYDYSSGRAITEETPLETKPLERDEYAQVKLLQEELVREFEKNYRAPVTYIRPGMIYGRDNLWNTCIGAPLVGNLWLKVGGNAKCPLAYVENCADAIIRAVERDEAIGETLNIIDDNLPTQNVYAQKLAQRLDSLPRMISISWPVMRFLAWIFWTYNQQILKGQARFPGIFIPRVLDARFKPFQYPNTRAKKVLQWQPKYSLDEAIDRSCSDMELLGVPSPIPSLQTVGG
ncbi:NAD-dependent epimerase/dehydratase family protein [Scytonema sp. UIC 10036]|uniref:NAD-dependent epimerase/dehydratase family protein n=1 Tax=Scytonema sp. UIC 10036 TaxID=2304196 RepID=UPI0012DA1CE3|nr:NAD(P)-dependent oxidoreductase [Scytonema sp. UIC 10036]MUH01190.1 NAD-dependent epimerase/dehydratase family protein [Scytonema sp. UIC 10036]